MVVHPSGHHTKFYVPQKYKRLVMSTRYRKSPYTARVALRNPLRETTVKQVCKLINREVLQLCKRNESDSFFRFGHIASLQNFSWKPLSQELSRKAPTLYATLKAVLPHQKRE